MFAVVAAGMSAAAWFGLHEKTDKTGRIRIGYAVEAPYAFLTEEGEVTGEGPEIARRISIAMGRGEPEWILTEFGSLLRDLRAGRFDVIAAGMFVTRERERIAAFSKPTARVGPGLLVARGNPLRLAGYRDAAKNGRARIAVLAESIEERRLQAEGMDGERVVAVPDPMAGLALLKSGHVDGLALSLPTVRWMAAKPDSAGSVEAVAANDAVSGDEGAVAFVFRKDDEQLRANWNRALDGFLGSVEHRRIEAEFGFALAAGEEAR